MASPNVVNGTTKQSKPTGSNRPRPQKPNYRHIHRFPLPVTIHALPPLIPHNPISVISVILSYLTTLLVSPPEKETYAAYFDSATSSVQVTDPKAMRALWEMGFFGKGSLSRSEPNWLEREKKRRGLLATNTSEEVTGKRRQERREMKLERAKKEQEAIALQLKEEAAKSRSVSSHPVNEEVGSVEEQVSSSLNGSADKRIFSFETESQLPNENRQAESIDQRTLSTTKTVRFSPVVEEKKFTSEPAVSMNGSVLEDDSALVNEEHLQLSNEEALFLAYGLGALQVFDTKDDSVIPTTSLIKLFIQQSTFSARPESDHVELDDPFLISYVAYHHFRSLGWIVRSGVKFGVDYLLYNRGPVFAHAEFAVLVLPSYDNEYWCSTPELKDHSAKRQSRSWWWLHGVNRVQAQVKKTLVLCYVDIPPPLTSPPLDNIGATLRRYKVREVLVRRWVPNRTR